MRLRNLLGQQFGRLAVLVRDTIGSQGKTCWICLCDCGVIVSVKAICLTQGKTRSCGCLKREMEHKNHLLVHGMSKTRTHKIWKNLHQRCLNPHNIGYKYYGGRGITFCEKWKTFEGFFDDMGEAPADLTIERIDNSQGYYKENCKWAIHKEQNCNTRRNRLLTFRGETACVSQWAEVLGLRPATIHSRLSRGWTVERTLTEPLRVRMAQTAATNKVTITSVTR